MTKKTHIQILLSLAGTLLALSVQAQELLYVTVDPETQGDVIYWDPSILPNVSYYWIGRVVLDQPPGDYHLEQVGQVNAFSTSFTNFNDPTFDLQQPVGYSVVALDINEDPIGGPHDYPDSTIFLEVEHDGCATSYTLNWTDYNTWRGNILEYNVRRRLGPGNYPIIATLDEGINTYVRNQLPENQDYEIFVEAVNIDGRRSNSNMVAFNSGDVPGPDSINADYATLGMDGGIDLSFTATSSGSYTYNLIRSTDPGGSGSVIQQFTSPGDSVFLLHDDIPFTSGIYFYRLEVPNECGGDPRQSNLANNILLNGTLDGMNVMLQWNPYLDWEGDVQQYTLTRYAGTDNPRVDLVATGLSTDWIDDISSLVDYSDPLENRICYQVEATENTNIYGIQGTSTSNRICFTVNTGILLPNAVIPNDPDNPFVPVFAFEPESYELIIYNRLGLKVWEGDNIGWDGTINGTAAPEGVYLYYFRIFNHSADITELSGSVTVVYP